jgi:hypothetical protein
MTNDVSQAHYRFARRRIREARAELASGEGVFAFPVVVDLLTDAVYHRHVARSHRRPPVVFLDFDGVLNGKDTREAPSPFHKGLFLNPECVERANRICERAGAVVVLTTSWRARTDETGCRVDVRAALRDAGFRGRVIGATPAFADWPTTFTPRRNEIQRWLAEYGARAYVVLDDHDDASIFGQFVRCDTRVGLTDADVEAAIGILRGGQ